MRQEQTYEDDVDENGYRGPSKSQLKREQNALQDLGREMTKLGDEQLKRIGLPDEVLVEIVEFRRLLRLGAPPPLLPHRANMRRNWDPAAVGDALDRVTGESRAAVALLHRCETLRDQMLAGDEALTKFISEHPESDIPRLRTLVRAARKEREAQKPPKSARELYRYLHDLLEEPISLFAEDDENEE